jgi:hypothetical protein
MSAASARRSVTAMVHNASERLAKVKRERPRLYAARHVAKGVGQVLLAVLGVGLAVRFLPLPDLPLPNLDVPEFPGPDLSVPGWLAAILGTAKFWVPILIGILVAIGEAGRRRKRDHEPETKED